MKKLKLYLEQIENTVVMRVIQQEGITGSLSYRINALDCPQMYDDSIYLRGKMNDYDHVSVCIKLDTPQLADEYLQKVIGWLDEVFVKQSEPKRGDEVKVWDYENYMYTAIFLAKIEGSLFPFYCVGKDYEKEFFEGKKFDVSLWKYMQPLTKSGYNPDTKTYEGELS